MDSPHTSNATIVHAGRSYQSAPELMPATARRQILDDVTAALVKAGVHPFVIPDENLPGTAVGLLAHERAAGLRALAQALSGPSHYVQEFYPQTQPQPWRPLSPEQLQAVPRQCAAVSVAKLWEVGPDLRYAGEYGCRVEFWAPTPDGDGFQSPDPMAALPGGTREQFEPSEIQVEGVARPSVRLFDRHLIDAVRFPVDVVYTWVDGDDPQWRDRLLRARAAQQGTTYHPESAGAQRYRARDELRYSLRSLAMYAPWVRHVYLVTDQQVPEWLDLTCPRLSVVDHREIFDDPSVLPVFNSSAIISQLHHIPGLAENYLYMNDDMFFGRDTSPTDFWHGSGIAKVFRSNSRRSVIDATSERPPHLNIATNIRALLEEHLGRTVNQAIQHTPYPQLRSVLYEIEQRWPGVVSGTAKQPFRHHDDVALDQLFHYYAQATGRAVPATINYEYLNIGIARTLPRLRRLLAARDRQVFCLNDAPDSLADPIADETVRAILAAYFPVPSEFEAH